MSENSWQKENFKSGRRNEEYLSLQLGIGQGGILVVKNRRNIGPSAREPLKSPKQSRKYFIGARRKLAKYKKNQMVR